MQEHHVVCEKFNDLNFDFAFKLYAEGNLNLQEVARSQLKNFVKSVAEV